MVGVTSRLSLSTQPGPSTSTPPARRPQGARKRGATPGLFVANPDNSDDEGFSPKSPIRASPVMASSSSSGRSGVPIAPLHSGQGGSPSTTRGVMPSMPTIPAPQPSPRQPASSPLTPQQSESTLTPLAAPPVPPVPPQPPPQPERHMRRAFTTPTPDHSQRPIHETRTASASSAYREMPPPSPSRALPLLPSPPIRSALPSPPPTFSSSAPGYGINGPPPPSSYQQPTPSSIRSHPEYLQRTQHKDNRSDSPEDVISPATNTSDGGRSMASYVSSDLGSRMRSGSTQSMVRLQVTTDNEQFTLVDITGMQTPEAIKERVYSKVSPHGCTR